MIPSAALQGYRVKEEQLGQLGQAVVKARPLQSMTSAAKYTTALKSNDATSVHLAAVHVMPADNGCERWRADEAHVPGCVVERP